MPKITISPTAREDLKAIKDYIARDNNKAAISYIQLLKLKFIKLSHAPKIGLDDQTYLGLKKFPVGNYLIFYRENNKGNGIEIARVLHAARDVEKILENN